MKDVFFKSSDSTAPIIKAWKCFKRNYIYVDKNATGVKNKNTG
jgi:hypothetical protein